ncbi:MAG: flavin reductase [Bacteroidales bacterium]|nr:flavin reductase [Bacteroidales bacterium]
MKTANYLNILLAIALVVVTFLWVRSPKPQQEETPQGDTETAAPKEWVKVDIDSAHLDPFKIFQDAAALTVGKPGNMNSMTIGWGSFGILWGHDSHVATVYVRKSRFTHHLMEENETFTIEAFPPEYSEKLKYLGTASGRDEDKMRGCGMTVKTMPCGAPAFEEGNIIIECRKIFTTDYATTLMDSTVVQRWYTKGEDFDNIHTAYVGEITGIWVKK